MGPFEGRPSTSLGLDGALEEFYRWSLTPRVIVFWTISGAHFVGHNEMKSRSITLGLALMIG